jgi:hypothetical protein
MAPTEITDVTDLDFLHLDSEMVCATQIVELMSYSLGPSCRNPLNDFQYLHLLIGEAPMLT